MKRVTKWVAEDGTEFDDQVECGKYESHIRVTDDFREWYAAGDNALFSMTASGKVVDHDLIEWIGSNVEQVVKLVALYTYDA